MQPAMHNTMAITIISLGRLLLISLGAFKAGVILKEILSKALRIYMRQRNMAQAHINLFIGEV